MILAINALLSSFFKMILNTIFKYKVNLFSALYLILNESYRNLRELKGFIDSRAIEQSNTILRFIKKLLNGQFCFRAHYTIALVKYLLYWRAY